jgi:hypothetical protein
MREEKLLEAEALHDCPGFRRDLLFDSTWSPRKIRYPELLALCARGTIYLDSVNFSSQVK